MTETRESIEDGGKVRPAGVEYFRGRNPDHFPSLEEYEDAARRFPEPILGSVEDTLRLEEEDLDRAHEVCAASDIS